MGLRCENPIPRLVAQLSDHEEGEDFGCPVLARVGAQAIPPLLEALHTPHDPRRRAICLTLKQLAGELEAFRPQLEEEAKSSEQVIRTAALAALGCLADNPAAQRVIDLLVRPDLPSQLAGLQSMGDLGVGGVPAIPHVLRLWLREAEAGSGTEFRLAAARAFSRMGPTAADAVQTLIGALAHPVLAVAMPRVFENIGRVAIPALTAAMRTLDPIGGRLAAASLYLASRSRYQILADLLADPETPNRPRRAILGLIGEGVIDEEPAIFPTVMTQLDHAEPTVRLAAVEALFGIGEEPESLVPHIARLSRAQDAAVRAATVRASIRIAREHEQTRLLLRRSLADSEDPVRTAAWEGYLALDILPLAIRDLRNLTRDDEPQRRAAAIEGLGRVLAYEGPMNPENTPIRNILDNLENESLQQTKTDAIELLIGALDDRSRLVRTAVVTVLAERLPQEAQHAFEPLVQILDDPAAAIREKAALAISRLEMWSEPAIRKCVNLLRDEDSAVVCAALQALGVMRKDRPEVDKRIKPFLRDESSRVRAAAGRAISTWDGPPEEVLNDALDMASDRSGIVRAAGMRMLTTYHRDLLGNRMLKHFRRAFQDEDVRVRRVAADGLNGSPVEFMTELLKDLVAALGRESDREVAEQMVTLLRQCPNRVDELKLGLDHANPQVRADALSALYGAGPTLAPLIPRFIGEFERNNRLTRIRSISVLERIGRAAATAVPHLARIIENIGTPEQEEALRIIGSLEEAGEPLVERLNSIWQDPMAFHRTPALHSLTRLSGWCPSAVRGTLAALRHSEIPIVKHALIGLSKSEERSSPFVKEVACHIHHPDAELRGFALTVLSKIGPAAVSIVHELVAALETETTMDGHGKLIKALGCAGPGAASAVPILIEKFKKEYAGSELASLRREILLALCNIATTESLAAIRDALFDRDGYVREQAAQVLQTLGPKASAFLPDICRALGDRKWDRIDDILTQAGLDRRMYLLDAIEAIQSTAEPVLPALQKMLEDTDEVLRFRTVEVLATLGPSATTLLRRALKNKNESVRDEARKILSQRGES